MASTGARYFNTMASSLALPSDQHLLYKSLFLGQKNLVHNPHKLPFTAPKQTSKVSLKTHAKFNLSEILGGRGLCNGEIGIEKELQRNVPEQASLITNEEQESSTKYEEQANSKGADPSSSISFPVDAFGKELMGLTGGFPGGEKGIQKFIEENPPNKSSAEDPGKIVAIPSSEIQEGPESPALLPGTIATVKNPNSPYYMYRGIVQHINDRTAGVLFEGGNWNRLKNFQLDELEQREKGPPIENPKSATVEDLYDKGSK